jgi:hypothetical protein
MNPTGLTAAERIPNECNNEWTVRRGTRLISGRSKPFLHANFNQNGLLNFEWPMQCFGGHDCVSAKINYRVKR